MKLTALLFTFAIGASAFAQSAAPGKALSSKLTPEQRTANYMESVRNQPPALREFLYRMPKGGDLHNHLTGAVYAESYIQWAASGRLCVEMATLTYVAPKQIAGEPPCDEKTQRPAAG